MELILSNRKSIKIIFALIAVSFLWFGTFGLLIHMNEMKQDGHMSGCLFDGQSEICAMNFSEHISSWQSAFTTLPPSNMLLNLLALAVFSIFVAVFWRNPLFEFFERAHLRWKFYIKRNSELNFFNPLREAFSQGILNPKIYDGIM
ncbi:MAG: hypothetical protein AAB837_03180 [Patescibacteria group bacterium]